MHRTDIDEVPLSISITTFQEQNEDNNLKVCVMHDQSTYEELETSKMEQQYQKCLFAMINHELRNPLHGILGIFDIIQNYNITDAIKQQCDLGISTGSLMLLLVNDILDISQLETCSFKLTEEIFKVDETLQNCFDLMKYRYEQKGIALNKKIKGDLLITNDRNRYKQIIINLLSNSLKFTSKGYVKITCEYIASSRQLLTKVKDTGEGIKQEEQDKIFTKYCKLKQQKSANPTGKSVIYI